MKEEERRGGEKRLEAEGYKAVVGEDRVRMARWWVVRAGDWRRGGGGCQQSSAASVEESLDWSQQTRGNLEGHCGAAKVTGASQAGPSPGEALDAGARPAVGGRWTLGCGAKRGGTGLGRWAGRA